MDVWLTRNEVLALPASGPAFSAVKATADRSDWGLANVRDSVYRHNVNCLAGALMAARVGGAYKAKVEANLRKLVGTEVGPKMGGQVPVLAISRKMGTYTIAADLIGFREPAWVAWLSALRTKPLQDSAQFGGSIVGCHEKRPSNFGTHSGASRAAMDVYLGDTVDLARCAQVFKGWLGDRSSYASFKYGGLWWQADPSKPVGINPVGAMKLGHSIDGVLPDDQRKSGGFKWPPPKENYVWEALQGATVEAQILTRAGFPAWEWSDRAIIRAFTWLYKVCLYPPVGDDTWQPWLVNKATGSTFPKTAARSGKNMGFTDWTHA